MEVERLYVKEFYEKVADSWVNIRQKFKIIEKFRSLRNKKIIEIGCGTATQLSGFKNDNFLVGVDFSKNMIKNAKEYIKRKKLNVCLIIADARNLPFKNDSFDFVFSIATIHHIKKRAERIKALNEMIRISKNICLISVLKRVSSLTIFRLIPGFLRFFCFGDILLEWKYRGKTLKRFYHTYSKREIKRDLEILKVKEFKIIEDKYNYYLIIKKLIKK
ncbi:MAG: class I SAM-dependent methyltransferase [Candidatus Aenigmatarchaeota archaeon]